MRCYLLQMMLLACCLNFVSTVDGQGEYLPTAVEGANWIMYDAERRNDDNLTVFVRFISGDTVVNDVVYKKYYERGIIYEPGDFTPRLSAPYEVLPQQVLIGLLRDDTTSQRVYGMVNANPENGAGFTSDTLLHDYSVGIGDTLRGLYFYPEGGDALIVKGTGVEEYGGELRRLQQTNYGYFYQGVGGLLGPTSGGTNLLIGVVPTYLVEYCQGNFTSCNLFLTSNENPIFSSVKLYPNPVSNILHLENLDDLGHDLTIQVLTSEGRLMRSHKVINPGMLTQLDLKELPKGHYFVRVTTRLGTMLRKVVKW